MVAKLVVGCAVCWAFSGGLVKMKHLVLGVASASRDEHA